MRSQHRIESCRCEATHCGGRPDLNSEDNLSGESVEKDKLSATLSHVPPERSASTRISPRSRAPAVPEGFEPVDQLGSVLAVQEQREAGMDTARSLPAQRLSVEGQC